MRLSIRIPGKELWRTFTVPAPGEPGSETWPKGDQWKTGGASVWVTGNYDPETNLAFWGTGNGGPVDGRSAAGRQPLHVVDSRDRCRDGTDQGPLPISSRTTPGIGTKSRRRSSSIIRRNGRTIKGLIDVARDGYLWFLERTDGPIRFVEGKPYVNQNVFLSLDPETGRPEVDPARKPGTGKTADFCPALHGGKNWPPIAFSPQTRMIYIPANNNICGSLTGAPVTYTAGPRLHRHGRGGPDGSTAGPGRRSFRRSAGVERRYRPESVDAQLSEESRTGDRCWRRPADWCSAAEPTIGRSTLSMRPPESCFGNLRRPSGILAPPTSFMIDGKQYIAVLSGWGGDSAGMQSTLNRAFPGEYPPVPEGGRSGFSTLD